MLTAEEVVQAIEAGFVSREEVREAMWASVGLPDTLAERMVREWMQSSPPVTQHTHGCVPCYRDRRWNLGGMDWVNRMNPDVPILDDECSSIPFSISGAKRREASRSVAKRREASRS